MAEFKVKVRRSINFDSYELLDDYGWVMAKVDSKNYGTSFSPDANTVMAAFALLVPGHELELTEWQS